MKVRRRTNLLIDTEAWVDGDESGDKGTGDKNVDFDRFIVIDYVEF